MTSATEFQETYGAVARNLRRTRERRELTIEQLSERSEVPGDRIRALEEGREMDVVSLAELNRLSGALDLPLPLLVDATQENRTASVESPRRAGRRSGRK